MRHLAIAAACAVAIVSASTPALAHRHPARYFSPSWHQAPYWQQHQRVAYRHRSHIRRHHWARRWRHHVAVRYAASSSTHLRMPSDCWTAARMGGPCGCFAESLTFKITAHVLHGWNLWLAQTWADVFPKGPPVPGAAAVWPHRHVAIIKRVHNDRTGKPVAITTQESWGERRVSLAGLVIVHPLPPRPRRDLIRWGSTTPL
jgi:hypothetical protein